MTEDRPQRRHTEVLAEVLGPLDGRRVADVGCGHGAWARRLADCGAARVLGLEPQPAALQAARTAGPASGVAWIAAAGEALPVADGMLDVVVYFNALHHVPVAQMDAALAEARRVLAPGGRLLAIEPLAEGPVFELVRAIEDESAVRAAAQAALARACAGGGWHEARRLDYRAPVRHANFEAFRDHIIAVDPARRAAVAAREAALRDGFYARARADGDGYWLDQPSRATLLVPAGGSGPG